uniref:protein-tyrosine-phosphatase n=1 Tax=Acrobeloides nanus TaxID=290746 RepID=A0A914EFS3_9BILA
MYQRPCHFYYNISGERAQELLFRYGSKGEFIIRPSESNKNDYTISVHRGDKVTHVKIINHDGILSLPTGAKFETLLNLVRHIVETQCTLPESDGSLIEMKTNCLIPKEEIPVNGGRDLFFHVGISAIESEELLKDEPLGSYLLRENTLYNNDLLMKKWAKTCGDMIISVA